MGKMEKLVIERGTVVGLEYVIWENNSREIEVVVLRRRK